MEKITNFKISIKPSFGRFFYNLIINIINNKLNEFNYKFENLKMRMFLEYVKEHGRAWVKLYPY